MLTHLHINACETDGSSLYSHNHVNLHLAVMPRPDGAGRPTGQTCNDDNKVHTRIKQ